MVCRLKQFCRNQARRLIAVGVLLTFVAALLPLPIPQMHEHDEESSEPFPCQHHHCGCRSADQCWKKCCCFTNAQKVAWAKSHHVQAPEFVIAAAKSESTAQSCTGGSCCLKEKPQAKVTTATPPSNCQISANVDLPNDSPLVRTANEKPDRPEMTYVFGFRAQECQGQVWGWSVLPWSILPPPPQFLSTSDRPACWPLPLSEREPETMREPPVPPPRVTCCARFVA